MTEDTAISTGTAGASSATLMPLDGTGATIREAFAVAANHMRANIEPIDDPRDGTEAIALVHSRGVEILDPTKLDPYRLKPIRRAGTATHTRLDSFIAHVRRFMAPNSAVFAIDDPKAPRLTAIFDYHPEGDDNTAAQFGSHRASYPFPLSEEWKAWSKANAVPMAMTDFAAFLEDHIVDVVADARPTSAAAIDFMAKVGGDLAGPSKLIEIARGLQVNEASTVREARNLSNGETEVVFNSVHLDANGNKLVMPSLFMICIPVFARSTDYWQILARFRYRKTGEGIKFWYELWRLDLVFEEAFQQACKRVGDETELPIFVGTPEL